MKSKIEKAKSIIKAFTHELPVTEEWYNERLDICDTCDYNSLNKDSSELSITEKLMTNNLCKSRGQCTACGCCIAEKTSLKTETCGLKELGLTPKWSALEVPSLNNKLYIEVLDNTGKVSSKQEGFLFDFEIVTNIVAKAKFKIKSLDEINYVSYSVSCGCTHPKEIGNTDLKEITVLADISTLGFKEGINEKTLTVNYKDKKGTINSAVIRFRIIKKYE